MKEENIGWNLDNSYLSLPDLFFSELGPNTASLPNLEIFNDDLGKTLGLDVKSLKSKEGLAILAGNQFPKQSIPIAQAYAGHQFGHFTMLGDGRAMLIGEQITPTGERFDIQLKGSGKTPYSRGGDGLAPLMPMLREYIISESMHYLGIPTSRSLAVVGTGDPVLREGRLPGAILTRVASNHIRVGTFQYAANFGTLEDVKALADYTIWRHFPMTEDLENPYLALLKEVIKSQASLIAKWQLVGFIHGVMNTDNMLICGETIDYGPCAFMDAYDPATVFSSIDRNSRYAYGNQASIGGWNLARFAESLLPLIHKDEQESISLAEAALKEYPVLHHSYWLKGMGLKLGILDQEKNDLELINDLLKTMQEYQADFTNTFIGLTEEKYKKLDKTGIFQSERFKGWYKQWQARLERQDSSLGSPQQIMQNNNPTIIPRNHQVEAALKLAGEKGDYTLFKDFLAALKTPYDYKNINEEYMMIPELTVAYRTFCGT